MDDLISRQWLMECVNEGWIKFDTEKDANIYIHLVRDIAPSAQPMRKRGRWIIDRSGAYCCSECMEPCAGYVMMKPRDKFCKMCGAKMEVTE